MRSPRKDLLTSHRFVKPTLLVSALFSQSLVEIKTVALSDYTSHRIDKRLKQSDLSIATLQDNVNLQGIQVNQHQAMLDLQQGPLGDSTQPDMFLSTTYECIMPSIHHQLAATTPATVSNEADPSVTMAAPAPLGQLAPACTSCPPSKTYASSKIAVTLC